MGGRVYKTALHLAMAMYNRKRSAEIAQHANIAQESLDAWKAGSRSEAIRHQLSYRVLDIVPKFRWWLTSEMSHIS